MKEDCKHLLQLGVAIYWVAVSLRVHCEEFSEESESAVDFIYRVKSARQRTELLTRTRPAVGQISRRALQITKGEHWWIVSFSTKHQLQNPQWDLQIRWHFEGIKNFPSR